MPTEEQAEIISREGFKRDLLIVKEVGLPWEHLGPFAAFMLACKIGDDPYVEKKIWEAPRDPKYPAVTTGDTLEIVKSMTPDEKAALKERIQESQS